AVKRTTAAAATIVPMVFFMICFLPEGFCFICLIPNEKPVPELQSGTKIVITLRYILIFA
ncbi:MAG: hypothetical protein WC345_12325, partial [Smithellaceae bacterium]